MTKNELLIKRIENAMHFLLTASASKFAVPHEREKTVSHLYALLETVKAELGGEKVVVNELREEPRQVVENAKEVFHENK